MRTFYSRMIYLKSNTSTALFDFSSKIQTGLDRKHKVSAIFFDLKKAFETVHRQTLLKKLSSYGVQGIQHKWFQNYLNRRQQYIEYNETTTKLETIDTGVPQGANLALTLLIIFINDIMKIGLNGQMYMYADDLAIVYEEKIINEVEKHMNDDCKKLEIWMNANKLTVNETKTNLYNI